MGRKFVYSAALVVMVGWAWISPLQALAQLPGSLIVTMTSPTSGSTVSGTVTVGASVSIVGSLTVAGVQFKLDGANLGAEDTTSPYSVSWNTTTASNGSHTLTAVARDLLGLRFTSNPVTVTVFNDKTPPTVSITSPAAGSTVSGTITVSATASDNIGVAGVQFFVDGAPMGVEDATAPYAAAWDTTTVEDGPYTLTARARDTAGNTATSAGVMVTVSSDGGAVTRFEETDPAISYTGNWYSLSEPSVSGGTYVEADAAGSWATFSFTGTAVGWIGARAPTTGIARVYLDGIFQGEVDTYAPAVEAQAEIFFAGPLPRGAHTLAIEATGTMNPAAGATWVVVDAFDVTP